MSQRKIRPFAAILLLVEELSPDQRLDLLDVLRGRPAKVERKKKEKVEKPPKEAKPAKVPICATCGNVEDFADHKTESPDYHIFRTDIKKAKAATQ